MKSRLSVSRSGVQWIGLVAGPILATLTYSFLPETFNGIQGEGVVFTHAGHITAALAVWMATWWLASHWFSVR